MKRNKMKYNCKNCNFHWQGNSDTFEKVLVHEKAHLKNAQIYSMEEIR